MTLSFRASEYDLKRIQVIKEYLAEQWGMIPEEISTSDIIKWSIGSYYYNTPKGEEERLNNLNQHLNAQTEKYQYNK